MKTRALLLFIVICLPIVFAFIPPASAEEPALVSVDVQREVFLHMYGVLTITDTITVTNIGEEPAFHVWTAFPFDKRQLVQGFQAVTEDGASLMVQYVPLISEDCVGWKIFTPEPVMPGRNFTYRVTMVLEGLTWIDTTTEYCTFSPIPTLPYFILNVTTIFDHTSGRAGPSQEEWAIADVDPYTYDPTTITLTVSEGNGKPRITFHQLKRTFTVDPWGYLYAHEMYSLSLDSINPSTWNWENMEIWLPPGADFIRAYDVITNLSISIRDLGNLTEPVRVQIDLAYLLRQGDVYTFYVEYRLPLDLYQVVGQNGFFLTFNPYSGYELMIRNQITEFVLPSNSRLLSAPEGSETTISAAGQYLIRYQEYNVSLIDNSEFSLHFVYPIQSAFTRPMVFSVIFGVLCLIYIAGRRIPIFREEEVIVAERPTIDPAILGEFCALYGEKVALLLQTERLERSMMAQKMSKPRYRKEKKLFDRKLRALERELQSRSRPLLDAGGKYESSCRQLELFEAERLSAVEAIHALEQRYKQKRVTPRVYQKLRQDLEKRRDKAIASMDRVLLDLREESS